MSQIASDSMMLTWRIGRELQQIEWYRILQGNPQMGTTLVCYLENKG